MPSVCDWGIDGGAGMMGDGDGVKGVYRALVETV